MNFQHLFNLRKFSFMFFMVFSFFVSSCSYESFDLNYQERPTYPYLFVKMNKKTYTSMEKRQVDEALNRFIDNVNIENKHISMEGISPESLNMNKELFDVFFLLFSRLDTIPDALLTYRLPKTKAYFGGGLEPIGPGLGKELVFEIICAREGFSINGFERKCFRQYWYAMGDMQPTDNEWSGIKQYAENWLGDKTLDSNNEIGVNYYGSDEYNYALGTAATKFNTNREAIGLGDAYDFNIEDAPDRTEEAQQAVMIIKILEPIYRARPYDLTYGNVPAFISVHE